MFAGRRRREENVSDSLREFETAESEPRFGEMTRGMLVMAGAAVALVAIAFAVMTALTGPNGWATKVASTSYAEDAVLVSGPLPAGLVD